MPKKELNLGIFVKDPSKADVSDSYLDRYDRLSQQEEILDNMLLGDFIDGKYVISTDIKYELIRKKKVVSAWAENGLKAIATIQKVNFEFQIEITDFDETQRIAYLFLIENMYDKKMKTFIADYLDEKSELFRDKAMRVFNVEMDTDYEEKDAFDNIYAKIMLLQQKNSFERRFVNETYSESYVNKMLKILASCGPIGQKILKEYEDEIRARGYNEKVVPELYIKLRKILNKTIKQNGGLKELATINPEVKNIVRGYVDPVEYYDKVVGKTGFLEVEFKNNKKEENKEEDKSSSSPAKKPSAPSKSAKPAAKGKDKPKAPAKKKDDKKKPVMGNFIPDPKQPIPQVQVQVNKVNPTITPQQKPQLTQQSTQTATQRQSVFSAGIGSALEKMNKLFDRVNEEDKKKMINQIESKLFSKEINLNDRFNEERSTPEIVIEPNEDKDNEEVNNYDGVSNDYLQWKAETSKKINQKDDDITK